jgi:predicted ATPase
VYGRLQRKKLSFTIQAECANSGRQIEIALDSDLNITHVNDRADPMFCIAITSLAKTKAPSIVDVF